MDDLRDQDRDVAVLPPLVVADANAIEWDAVADVVIAGFGGAGVVAALEARAGGASVIVVERFGGGGSTAVSGGVVYAGSTRYQAESGFKDTPEEMYKYLHAIGSAVQDETLRRFCQNSSADLEWLAGFDVPFGGNAFTEKTNFPPDGYWLFYSGTEKLMQAHARPAPRGHRVRTSGLGGHLYFEKLRRAALTSGVQLITHAPVRRLIVNAAGDVIGVRMQAVPNSQWQEHDRLYNVVAPWKPFNGAKSERAIVAARALERRTGTQLSIRATRGVLLATGGFIYNLDLLGKHRPELQASYHGLHRSGRMGDDSSGIRLGESAGAATAFMGNIAVGCLIAPPNIYTHGVMVNLDGNRFANEGGHNLVLGGAITQQPGGGKAWMILQAADFWTAVKQAMFPGKGLFKTWGAPALLNILLGGTRRASTVRKLAVKCKIDPDGLERTVAAFNQAVQQRRPDAFGKLPEMLQALTDGPFYAVNFSLDNKFAIKPAFTQGGLVVEEMSGAVLRADGSRIKGLYAAGRTAVGLCSKVYASGLALADTVFSGRRAGRELARDPSRDFA